ncbi:MAG: cysteine desulfurase [Deltaproteobacteria bacterium]|nr:cysteine desulfurase [Deltaproteobacteria bacterium]
MPHREPLNFDVNATYGVERDLLLAACEKSSSVLNPSSVHAGGQKGRALLETSRELILTLIDAPPGARGIFTSGATESNNSAIGSPFLTYINTSRPAQIIISAIEHPSVEEPAERLCRQGVFLTRVFPRAGGKFAPSDFAEAVLPHCKLVSVMLANNETGQILPVKEICEAIRSRSGDALLHCDAVQALGKIPLSMKELGADMLSISAHKVGGLPGCGMLVLKDEHRFSPFMLGGSQESRQRAGTESVLGAVIFAESLARRIEELPENHAGRMTALLQEILLRDVPSLKVNFENLECLPNTLNLQLPGVRADDLVAALDIRGILVSSGSACASGKPLGSKVLERMGLSKSEARQSIRVSLGAQYDEESVKEGAEIIVSVMNEMLQHSSTFEPLEEAVGV